MFFLFVCLFVLFGQFPYRNLASGDSLISLVFTGSHLGHTAVINSVHMVCAAIEKGMMEEFLPRPTPDTWKEVAQSFWEKNGTSQTAWEHLTKNMPLSKHQTCPVANISIIKKTVSTVLLALVDAGYQFGCIQVGDFGRTSDGGVCAGSDLGRWMENKTLLVPQSTSLPGAAHLRDEPYAEQICSAADPVEVNT